MPRRRKKKNPPLIYPSAGPLPWRLADRFAGCLLVFSDASQKRLGGIAAVLFGDADGEPLVATRSLPAMGSNELELQAALFAIQQAQQHFPGRPYALFSDNQDTVSRLNRARSQGLVEDAELAQMLAAAEIAETLGEAEICWIKGHATCRGNILADQHATAAAA